MRLKQEVERKRQDESIEKGVVVHHNDARPQTALATQQKLRVWLGMLMHLPYSADLAPSDFHLFRPFQKSLGNVRLT